MNSNAENKIVIFASFEKFAVAAMEAITSKGLSIEIVRVNQEDCIQKAKNYKLMNKEIIIARGMIADSIRENVDINVVNVDIKLHDILELICDSKNIKKKIALAISNEALSDSVINIGNLLGIEINKYSPNIFKIKTLSEIAQMIEKEKIEAVVSLSSGDDNEEVSKILNVDYIVINPSKEAMSDAIQKAIDLYEMTMRERTNKEKLKTIIDHNSEGILAIDEKGIASTFNFICTRYFNIEETEIVGKHINAFFSQLELVEAMGCAPIQITDSGIMVLLGKRGENTKTVLIRGDMHTTMLLGAQSC